MFRLLSMALVLTQLGGIAHAERGISAPVPDHMWERMQGVSWHKDMGCPGRDDLRLLDVPYSDFSGDTVTGQLIVARDIADDVLDIFDELHQVNFPIARMQPVHMFFGKDDLSMAANNTSAFNCRYVGGTTRLSEHAFGKAIDINPIQNPYVKGSYTSPDAGEEYNEDAERSAEVPGVIKSGDVVVQAFKSRGWGWGGDWSSSLDYQHFSVTGR